MVFDEKESLCGILILMSQNTGDLYLKVCHTAFGGT
jgi:hypothetical protein